VRIVTLAAVFVGAAVLAADLLALPPGHLRDPWYWSALAIFIGGVALGYYVRRNDPTVHRSDADEAGVTVGIRARLGLWDPADPSLRAKDGFR
jgi:H+/Cl- antiporter ClcA